MKRILFTILLGTALFVSSCTKPESGQDGPEVPDTPTIPDTESGLYFLPEELNADSPCTIWFKPSQGSSISSELYNCSTDIYAHIGLIVDESWAFVQADWNTNLEKCRFEKIEDNLYKLEIKPSIREYFNSGTTPVHTMALVIRNSQGSKQTRPDQFVSVKDDLYQNNAFEADPVIEAAMPSGAKEGINYNSDNSVTLVLSDLSKSGKHHDYAYVIGEFSGWERVKDYMMKWDKDSGCWWFTFTNVDPSKEYLFQYHLGDTNSNIRIHDAYSEVVYDPWNDKYISSSTYPGITPYPAQTKDLVGAFKIDRDHFDWSDFSLDDEKGLVIYEMLFRDFTSTHDIKGAMEKLDYLQELGVGAVEIMPVQEFDGNESWGYNPNSYFALDKAYGTPQMYKTFIDECHKRGIAVIVDVVYNHATGSHPFAKMYWDKGANNVNSENPWFNVDTPHQFGVFHDWNHQEPRVVAHVERSLEYLLKEYHVDGFRFDLTKGFTNNRGKESSYDQQRVDVLKEYGHFIKSINPKAVVIFEHFVDAENNTLGAEGFHMWGNFNSNYSSVVKGGNPDLTFSYDPNFYRVAYMESHDEERICCGTDELAARMTRAALAAAHFLTIPGPRMIWQFGEMGYDFSINYNGSNVASKPIRWDYLDVPERRALHDIYEGVLRLRNENPELFTKGVDFTNGKTHYGICGEKAFYFTGNFTNSTQNMTATMPLSGTWRNWFDSSDTFEGSSTQLDLEAGEFRIYVNF